MNALFEEVRSLRNMWDMYLVVKEEARRKTINRINELHTLFSTTVGNEEAKAEFRKLVFTLQGEGFDVKDIDVQSPDLWKCLLALLPFSFALCGP